MSDLKARLLRAPHRLTLQEAARSPRASRMPGRYFDEWTVGDVIAHPITRTVTETDNLLISTLTHNPQPLHLDAEAAKATEFGQPLVNSCFTFSLAVGISVGETTLGTLVANLGYDEMRFPKPVFVGDTLRIESECLELAREQVAAQCRDRHLGASRDQSARRDRLHLQALGAAAQDPGMTHPRSWLFVPADSERKIGKALASAADAIILDLEDSVAPEPESRRPRAGPQSRARRQCAGPVGARQSAWQRISHGRSRKCSPMRAIHGIVLPKAESGADVTELAHRTGNIPIHAIVTETAAQPVRTDELQPSRTAAGGDELGRRGSVGGARRGEQI